MYSVLSVSKLSKVHKVLIFSFMLSAGLVLGGGRAHAATLNVTGGCTLNIAIASVNAGSDQSGCTATVSPSAYGTNDTITIPAGTQTLTGDLPAITESVAIQGAGIGQTLIDGDTGLYTALRGGAPQLSVSGITFVAPKGCAISFLNANITLNNVEVDGANAAKVSNNYCGMNLLSNTGSFTISTSNIYVHSFNATGSEYVEGILVDAYGGSSLDVSMQNTTLADVHAGTGGINGIFVTAAFLQSGGGTVTANIVNTTADNVTSTGITAPFANIAFANGGDASVTTVVNNITVTGTRGVPGSGPLTGLNTAAFYSIGMGAGSGDVGTANVSIGNSLMADNLTDSTPSNCFQADLTPVFGGSGSGVASIASHGYNIADDNSCGFTQTGDQHNIGNIISTLGPLQDNGGNVPTRALLAGSPAIAAGGHVLGVSTDARGIARPDSCPSIGAYQFVGAVCAATTVNGNSGTSGTHPGVPNTGIGPASPSSSVATILSTLVAGLGILGIAVVKIRRHSSAAAKR